MVDILKKLLKKPDTSLDATFAEKLLTSMSSLDSKISGMDQFMSEVFEKKFCEFKQSYTQELNNLLITNTNEKTTTVLKEYNELMQDKTKIFFNEFFPKNNEIITNQISNTFGNFDKLINSTEGRLQSAITESKNNIESKLTDINTINNTQNDISKNINTLITKFHGSSTKGYFSEVSVVDGLTRIFPYGNVEHVGNKISSSGDIMLTRKDKNKIMIENKEYGHTVPQVEIQKFIDNAVLRQADGIMISQQTQISNKDDFEININGEIILIYICNMGYNMDKLRTAISIIDHLKDKIAFVNKDKIHVILSQEEIDSINTEYVSIINQKKYLLKIIVDSHNKIIKEVENIRVPTLEYILMKEYGIKLSDKEDCKWCGKPCKNAAGVSAHLKKCEIYLESEQFVVDEEKKITDLENKLNETTKKTKKTKKGVLEIK
jgi:hypothetical protein